MMPVVHDDSDAASPSAPQPRSRRTVWYAAAALTATAGVLLTATVVLARRPSATPAIAATLAGGNDTAKATPSTSTSTSTSDKTSSIQPVTEQNVARTATAKASSEFSGQYSASLAIDGVTGLWGTGEWASKGEPNPWLKLTWSTPQTVDRVTFYDRPNMSDWTSGGTLTFSDGSTLTVSGIPNNGAPYSVAFPPKTITSLKFECAGGRAQNVGLSEIQVYGNAAVTQDATAAPSS